MHFVLEQLCYVGVDGQRRPHRHIMMPQNSERQDASLVTPGDDLRSSGTTRSMTCCDAKSRFGLRRELAAELRRHRYRVLDDQRARLELGLVRVGAVMDSVR